MILLAAGLSPAQRVMVISLDGMGHEMLTQGSAAREMPALRRLIEWLAEEGMQGLIVAGTTGEWFSMNHDEKAALFETVGEVLTGELPLIAGCNAFTASEAIRNAETAARSGFDGILVTPPPYVRPCEREVIAFYEDINAASPLPITRKQTGAR